MASAAELLLVGTRHHEAGRFVAAEDAYRTILRFAPNHAQALHQLGVLMTETGRPHEAVELIERALEADGSQATYYVNLGEAYRRLDDQRQAIACNERALQLDSSLAPAHANLGMLYESLGEVAKAIEHFRKLADLAPNDAYPRALLGRALVADGNLAEAEACFRFAVRAGPNDARAHYNLGTALQGQNKLSEAADCYRRAIAIDPRDAAAHCNLGSVRQRFDAVDEAEIHFRAALAVNPDFVPAHNNLAAALVEQFRHEEALVHALRAIELNPDFAGAHSNAALALQSLGRLDEAIAHHRRAIALSPDDAQWHDALLYLLNFHSKYSPAEIAAEHRAWAARHADPLTARAAPHANARTANRRLRIGYVSPYFLNHAVNFFVEPILALHDHARFEVYCYSDARRTDDATARLRASADHWRESAALDDVQLSEAVRDDRIDILVDLTGHIGGSRLLAFARQPAPVQVTYIGYQNTTGMAAMDYRLTDAYADPAGVTDEFYSETLVRLPRTFFCYRPSPDAPPVSAPPAASADHVTFGAFHNFTKVSPGALRAWAEILARVPRSRLLLLVENAPSLRRQIAGVFASGHVAPDRFEFVERVPRAEYLARMGRVDIALDAFPFNGHTTTCDCLWQGVGVVTLSGQTYASRFGGSGLVTLGLKEWIATTVEQYVEIAVELAGDGERLTRLRRTLRERMAASPLLDFESFTRYLEAEYLRMWAAWCESGTRV